MIWKKLKKSLLPEEKKEKSSPSSEKSTPAKKVEKDKTPPRRILTAEGWKRMMLGKKAKK